MLVRCEHHFSHQTRTLYSVHKRRFVKRNRRKGEKYELVFSRCSVRQRIYLHSQRSTDICVLLFISFSLGDKIASFSLSRYLFL